MISDGSKDHFGPLQSVTLGPNFNEKTMVFDPKTDNSVIVEVTSDCATKPRAGARRFRRGHRGQWVPTCAAKADWFDAAASHGDRCNRVVRKLKESYSQLKVGNAHRVRVS